MDPYPCSAHNLVPTPHGHVPMHLPFYTVTYNPAFMRKGIRSRQREEESRQCFPGIRTT
jgi:hypothetical protein